MNQRPPRKNFFFWQKVACLKIKSEDPYHYQQCSFQTRNDYLTQNQRVCCLVGWRFHAVSINISVYTNQQSSLLY